MTLMIRLRVSRTRKAMKQLSRQFRVATWNMYGFSLAVAAQTRAFKGTLCGRSSRDTIRGHLMTSDERWADLAEHAHDHPPLVEVESRWPLRPLKPTPTLEQEAERRWDATFGWRPTE